jgi:hypothetical protein
MENDEIKDLEVKATTLSNQVEEAKAKADSAEKKAEVTLKAVNSLEANIQTILAAVQAEKNPDTVANMQVALKAVMDDYTETQKSNSKEKERQEALKSEKATGANAEKTMTRLKAHSEAHFRGSVADLKPTDRPHELSLASASLLEAYDDMLLNTYTAKGDELKDSRSRYEVGRSSYLSLSSADLAPFYHFTTQSLRQNDIDAAMMNFEQQGIDTTTLSFSPVSVSPEFYDAEFTGMLKDCFQDPSNIVSQVSKMTVGKMTYNSFRRDQQRGLARFETSGVCKPTGAVLTPVTYSTNKRSVKALSSLLCINTDELEEVPRIDIKRIINEDLVTSGLNSLNEEIMIGGQGAFEGILPNIDTFNVVTSPSPPPAGAFISWEHVIAARQLILQSERSSSKIYGSNSGFVALATTKNAFGDLSNVVSFAGGEFTIAGMKYVVNDYLPNGLNAFNPNAPLLLGAVNFMVGDIAKAYTLVERSPFKISRFDPTNGGNCATFMARGRFDGYLSCKKSLIGIKS